MRAPPATLDEALALLRGYDLGRGLPRCEEVVLYELSSDDRFDAEGAARVDRARLVAVERYRDRFAALLDEGYAWINLHLAGVVDGRWVVIVELPRERATARGTSVNLSGPTRAVVDRGGWLLTVAPTS